VKKGLFIVIEGIDGSGKGTQSKLLYTWLKKRGSPVILTQEPTYGEIGKIIRNGVLKGELDPTTEALLFAADRKKHTDEISDELEKGKVVVCDRYLDSSMAYQGAHGLDRDWLRSINNFSIKPDILIILDISPDEALKRVNTRGERTDYFEKVEFLKKVRSNYLQTEDGLIIDAGDSIEKVQEEIKKIVSRFLR
jgi:dTMP kinase